MKYDNRVAFIQIFTAIALLFLGGCELNKLETYKKEAKAFCEIHNPDSWKEFAKTDSPTELKKRT